MSNMSNSSTGQDRVRIRDIEVSDAEYQQILQVLNKTKSKKNDGTVGNLEKTIEENGTFVSPNHVLDTYRDFICETLEANLAEMATEKVIKQMIGVDFYGKPNPAFVKAPDGLTFANSLISFLNHYSDSNNYFLKEKYVKEVNGSYGEMGVHYIRVLGGFKVVKKQELFSRIQMASIGNCALETWRHYPLTISEDCSAKEKELMQIWNEIRREYKPRNLHPDDIYSLKDIEKIRRVKGYDR